MQFSIRMRSLRAAFAVSAMAIVLAGCQTPNAGIIEPTLTPVTKQSHTLRTLPAPDKRMPVAVYDFPDLTGQYKERDNVQSLSRAVTQGGAPMLIKALQDAGERRWFSVLDRARLDDILKERQIVTEMRRIYRNEQQIPPSVLPPLSHAGIIMQGGITGFDTNVMTGGVGARYLGIGADAKWQQDAVTVTLRAVSTNTGEVLASVSVHKMIASYALQGGVFRYVALDKILEAEAGVTQNEPKQIAVQQAIEKAVTSLIIEGAELGVWSFADRTAGHEIIEAYNKEKYGKRIADAPSVVPAPATPNAADVVETRPVAPARVAAAPRARAPAAAQQQPVQAPQTPPPAGEGEVLGTLPAPETDDAPKLAEADQEAATQVASIVPAPRFAPSNKPQPSQRFQR